MMKTQKYPYNVDRAVSTLRRNDPMMADLIDRVGPYNLKLRDQKTPFQALLQSIIYQQLSGKAAKSIHGRVLNLFPHRYPSPSRLMSIRDTELQAAGLSRAKVKAVNDLAAKCADKTVPHSQTLKRMPDEEIIEGGPLIEDNPRRPFSGALKEGLGRPDVLPVGDLGVLKGFRIAYGLKSNPDPNRMRKHGERWRPYRSIASWYLWRANDL